LNVIQTSLPGVLLLQPKVYRDDRGFFLETYRTDRFGDIGIPETFVQDNHSRSQRGVLRGLHYQEPDAQGKLVRCTRGAIFDVVVDLRPASPTFLGHIAVPLDADNRLALYVPEGCAHGFQTLTDDTEMFYQMSAPHAPEAARGVRWNDPAFAIRWPPAERIMADRDRAYPDFCREAAVVG
jgi:dTDP-4-dehydrorhamnose 3,5-epimerase